MLPKSENIGEKHERGANFNEEAPVLVCYNL
jgi:hypothetical protein